MPDRPNKLFLMCDQFRFDCIAALGNRYVQTPNIDRLVKRGITFTNAYSTCPVCVPARWTLRTGREPYTTGCFENCPPAADIHERCGKYLAEVLSEAGYRTYGIGKFHTATPDPYIPLGYDEQLHTEAAWSSPQVREKDAYAGFMRREHPEYDHIQQLHGERTDMYYFPQMSPFPPELTVEGFVAGKAADKLAQFKLGDPFFCFVSFVGPHPPCAPPIPFNYLYNPDEMPNPAPGNPDIDFMDEQIPWMNHLIWADEINDFLARSLRARYLGEITYIDDCIGKILDAVERRPDTDNTLICFFSDHGDHLGDHSAWQKESYFEASCHVPFLLSWPKKYPGGVKRNDLVCLTDLFGVATAAAGCEDVRDGVSVMGILDGKSPARDHLFACYGQPGTPQFKSMIRFGEWKYIFLANGGREQLFRLSTDPGETTLQNESFPDVLEKARTLLTERLNHPGLSAATDKQGNPKTFPYQDRPRFRIKQFDHSSGVFDFTLHL